MRLSTGMTFSIDCVKGCGSRGKGRGRNMLTECERGYVIERSELEARIVQTVNSLSRVSYGRKVGCTKKVKISKLKSIEPLAKVSKGANFNEKREQTLYDGVV